jgi:ABC-type transport system involved in multi-copper enzyme maturation permease subunit
MSDARPPTGPGSERDTGSGDTGSGDTGSGDTGSGDTGSGDTGSGDTGSGEIARPWTDRRVGQLLTVAQREFDTVVRTRTYTALAVVFGLVVVALPSLGGLAGYLPLVLDLLTAVEVLVPVLAFGFGTWTVLADAQTGELEVVRTYPVGRSTYVLGAYLGRAVGLLVAILAPLVVLGVATPVVREPATSVLASHGTVDSPTYFLRFVALTCVYGLVALALAMGVSALARSRRSGVAAAVVALLVVVLGFDVLVVLGVGQGIVGPGTLPLALAASPPAAFRGLVLETAAGGLVETGPPAANAAASVIGLVGWLVAGLVVATLRAWSSVGD